MTDDAFLVAALEYAAMGWGVFPLASRSKVPLIRGGHGVYDATTSRDQIAYWWRRWPYANIGLAMGEPSGGIFALDVDPRNGGDESLLALLEDYGPLPDTPESLTGGGGLHILLRGDVPGAVLAPGIEVKSTGGYIVAPPSIHENGRPYLWEATSDPRDIPVALSPKWLLAKLGTNRRGRRFTHSESVDPATFSPAAEFRFLGWLGPEIRPGVLAAICPNRRSHTTGRDFDGSTVIFAPRPGKRDGILCCLHEHCRGMFR